MQRSEEELGRSGLSKAEVVRAYASMLEDRESLTIKQLMIDLKYGKNLVDSILSGGKVGVEDGGSGNNGIDEGDSDDASTSNARDNEDDTSYYDA